MDGGEGGCERLHVAEDRRTGAGVDEQSEHYRTVFVELAQVEDLRSAHGTGGDPTRGALIGVGCDATAVTMDTMYRGHDVPGGGPPAADAFDSIGAARLRRD